MTCPDCGSNLRFCEHDWWESHGLLGLGEHFHDEWYVCIGCGSTHTTEELSPDKA